MPASKTVAKKVAPKKEKVETKHVTVVVEMKHGPFFLKHAHYMVNVIQVRKELPDKEVGNAMLEAIRMARKLLPMKGYSLKVLTAETVEIASYEEVSDRAASVRGIVEGLSRI